MLKAEKLDRVHIAVKDLDKAAKFFSKMLGTNFSRVSMENEDLQIKVVMSPIGLELVAPTSPSSALAKFLETRGEGLFSLCFKVANIEEAIEHFQSLGMRLMMRLESGGLKEAQFHPKGCLGVSIFVTEYEEVHGAEVAHFREPDRDTTE